MMAFLNGDWCAAGTHALDDQSTVKTLFFTINFYFQLLFWETLVDNDSYGLIIVKIITPSQ